MTAAVTFRIRACCPLWAKRKKDRKLFWEVIIYPTLAGVRRLYGRGGGDCLAFVRHHWDKRLRQTTGELGVIAFSRTRLGGEIVAHEAAHAALTTIETMTGRTNFRAESLCRCVGFIAGELARGFYKRGIWK